MDVSQENDKILAQIQNYSQPSQMNQEFQQENTKSEVYLKRKYKEVSAGLIYSISDSLVDKLQKQLEYYFGDKNLEKDKYLLNLIERDKRSSIDIECLLDFNRIKSLIQDCVTKKEKLILIQKAVEQSELLELINHKLRVRRILGFQKIQQKEQVDSEVRDLCTIYVENIPEDFNLENMAEIFNKAGEILRIDLPQKKKSDKIKGFGFIEFLQKEQARKAVDMFHMGIPYLILGKNYQQDGSKKAKSNEGNNLGGSQSNTVSSGRQSWKVMLKQEWEKKKMEFQILKEKLKQQIKNSLENEQPSNQKQQDLHQTFNQKNQNIDDQIQTEFIKCILEIQNDCLLQVNLLDINFLKQPHATFRTQFKILVEHVIKPAFIDFENTPQIVIRFSNSNHTEIFLNHNRTQQLIQNNFFTLTKFDQKKEASYWQKIEKEKNKSREKNFTYKNKKNQIKNNLKIKNN